MGVHEHTLTAEVDPSVVWERWTNPELWATDDPGVTKAKLNGPLAKGALGWVQPTKGPRTAFRIVEVNRQKLRFATERKLLLATLRLEHEMTRPPADADASGDEAESDAVVDPNAWQITHRITISGPLTPLWERLVGRGMRADLPFVIANVAAVAAV